MRTIETALRGFDMDLSWGWHAFDLPEVIEKGDDPMRTWTIDTESNSRQLINGACQLINSRAVVIRKN